MTRAMKAMSMQELDARGLNIAKILVEWEVE